MAQKQKTYRIDWSCGRNCSDTTYFIGSLKDAHKAARKLIGTEILNNYDDETHVGRVENAYVVDDNGNPI